MSSKDFPKQLDDLFYRELRGKTITNDQAGILKWAEERLKPAIVKLHEAEILHFEPENLPNVQKILSPEAMKGYKLALTLMKQRAAITPKEDK